MSTYHTINLHMFSMVKKKTLTVKFPCHVTGLITKFSSWLSAPEGKAIPKLLENNTKKKNMRAFAPIEVPRATF